MTGNIIFQLHCHLPFVRHPEHEYFLEEDWLFEAVADCYLPLLDVLEHLKADNVPASITMGITPPLATMLTDELLQTRTARYLALRQELAEKDAQQRGPHDPFRRASDFSVERTRWLRRWYDDLGRDLCRAFKRHWDDGRIELITCNATHGMFPLLNDERAIRAQLWHAVRTHERIFDREPKGIWLAECAVWPGIASLLAEFDLRFTFVETHALLMADPPAAAGCYAPIYGDRGVAFFARDPGCARQVWSADEGYPGDPAYREFYRDLGWDLPYEMVKPYIQATGDRKNTGLKYHRVTGKVDLGHKQPYDPEVAHGRAREHGWHFARRRVLAAREVNRLIGQEPCVVAPFDAELFGHWWFEGPVFLEHALRALATLEGAPRPVTPPQYLRANPTQQVAEPAVSSWGEGGYFKVWCQGANDWLWRPVLQAKDHFAQHMDGSAALADGWPGRVARQAARELLLAQSSDWPFILATNTQTGYGTKRPITHLARFWRLMDLWKKRGQGLTPEELHDLEQMEARDNIFEDVNTGVFA
ncbi:MAG: 1,4-alpha-glucan branching protein domain-containing protein [Myxococcota bacterium]